MNIPEEIRSLLPENCPLGREIYYCEEIDSTNRLAKQLAADGAAHGTAVLADRQHAGRGRLGKSFHSPSGGLYLSVIVRPSLQSSDMMAVTACTASAVNMALRDFGIQTQIKWVNDLFLNDRKLCGILCEGGFHPQTGVLDYLIIGIGVNLRKPDDLPAELVPIVTSIEEETGKIIPRNALTVLILCRLHELLSELPQRTFLETYTQHSYTIGKRVVVSRTVSGNVSRETREECGLAVGYSKDAGLIVRFDDGNEEIITSGTAVFAEQ